MNFMINLIIAMRQLSPLEKQVRFTAVQSIHNPNMITIAVNLKECFEFFRDKKFNKKHKGIPNTLRA